MQLRKLVPLGARVFIVDALSRTIRTLFAFAPWAYHLWYYHSYAWEKLTWTGVPTLKSPADMWNYQEILASLRPALVVEFGTCKGGSALFFAFVMRQIGQPFKILSVDIDQAQIDKRACADPDIELLQSSSADQVVAAKIAALKVLYPGPVFAILDSDHSKKHVLAEMELLRPLLAPGDYLVVEDSNVNGHPVGPLFGPGPYEAIREYVRKFPEDYWRDREREKKFGFTFAPKGFLVRRGSAM